MKSDTKTPAPSAGASRIPLKNIQVRPDLQVRHGNLSEHHVSELRQAVKRSSKLPPLTVWQETGDDGKPTGRLVLLDGRHRLAALREEKPGLAEVNAEVFHGTRQEAFLAAASKNTKASLPLTRWEATNAAWAAVRMDPHPYVLSKKQIACDCGVSARTVATMRARWKAWPEDGPEPSGDWQRDKRDGRGSDEEPMTPDEYLQQRQEEIDKAAAAIRKAVGPMPEHDLVLFAEAVAKVAGWRLRGLMDYFGHAREEDDEDAPWTGLEGDQDPNAQPEF